MDWIFGDPQNSYVEALTSYGVVLGDGALWEIIRYRWRHKGRVLTIGLVSSEEGKTPEPPFHVHTQERPCEDTVRRWLTDPASRRSVQFNHLVTSNSLQLYGLQHTRLLCPSPTPEACSNSCPSSQWCHPTISSSVIPFSSCLQSFPASGSFAMSLLFTSGGQSIGASASVLPVNIQDPFPLGLIREHGTLENYKCWKWLEIRGGGRGHKKDR